MKKNNEWIKHDGQSTPVVLGKTWDVKFRCSDELTDRIFTGDLLNNFRYSKNSAYVYDIIEYRLSESKPVEPSDWVTVPREPTEEMIAFAIKDWNELLRASSGDERLSNEFRLETQYKAMLSAKPEQTDRIAELTHELETLNSQGEIDSITSLYDTNTQLEADKAKLLEALIDARDDVFESVNRNAGYLPYKQERYDASVEQLKKIEALIKELESK